MTKSFFVYVTAASLLVTLPPSALSIAPPGIPKTGPIGAPVLADPPGYIPPALLAQGLTSADWRQIVAAYERGRHSAFAEAAGELTPAYRMRNPRQSWVSAFDGRGVNVAPDGGEWSWGLELASYGRVSGAVATGRQTPSVRVEDNRLAYVWSAGLEEWYLNDARGLEHGFILRERPGGGAQPVELRMNVRGSLMGRLAADGGVSFSDETGETAIEYQDLKVWDAAGRLLPARLSLPSPGALSILIDDHGASYPLTVDPIAQRAYLKASNTNADDWFGYSVSLSGDTLVVGAPLEDSSATGINGNQSNNSAGAAGAAYVFVRNGSVWSQQAYLKASNTNSQDNFGYSVSISGDTIVVGAHLERSNATGVNGNQADNSIPGAGAAYVFVRSNGIWAQEAYLKASNTDAAAVFGERFGSSVAISGDTIVVAAHREYSNATGVNGDQSNNSAPDSGAAYVFVRDLGAWSQQAYLKASNTNSSDFFGSSVSISGDRIVVGASGESSAAKGVNGNQADNTAVLAGAAYVFARSGAVWAQEAYLKASNTDSEDRFGWSVSISDNTVVVGAYQERSAASGVNGNQADNSAFRAGAAYVFVRTASWAQQAYLKASNAQASDWFGNHVVVAGDRIAVGAMNESSGGTGVNANQNDNSASSAGAVYLFVRGAGAWTQQAYLKASNAGASDQFGVHASLSGDTLVVSAHGESSGATGIDGNQADNSSFGAGADYVFSLLPVPDKVAVYRPFTWQADRTGNGILDPGLDLEFTFGVDGAVPVAGDWNGSGVLKAGLYKDGFWFLDYDGNGVWDGGADDRSYEFGWAGVTPFVGDWNGDGADTIGIYIDGFWFLDADGDGIWDGPGVDIGAEFGWDAVTPVVGDWNGDGRDKIGIFVDGFWYMDYNGNGLWEGPITDRDAHFGWAGVMPLVGDWNGDGSQTPGIYIDGFWYLDADGSGAFDGSDIQADFNFGGIPVWGDWNGDGRDKVGMFTNGVWSLDFDGNTTWDSGVNDKTYSFGQPGDTPLPGGW